MSTDVSCPSIKQCHQVTIATPDGVPWGECNVGKSRMRALDSYDAYLRIVSMSQILASSHTYKITKIINLRHLFLWLAIIFWLFWLSLQRRRPGFNPWVRKIPWRRKDNLCSSILAWRIPSTEEPEGLQSRESQRVGHNSGTFTLMFHYMVFCFFLTKTPLYPGSSLSSWE